MAKKENAKTQANYGPGPGPGMPGPMPGPMPGGRHQMKLAHAYVPYQRYTRHYPPEEALMKGTLFPDLYMPYRRGQGGYY